MKRRALLAWSSGKDSAWALHRLRGDPNVEVVGLLTTFNRSASRVAMHAVRRELVAAQAEAVGLPLRTVELPWPCPNETYEDLMRSVLREALEDGVTAMAFGDLHLRDVREYRERQLADTGIRAEFPLWGEPERTHGLAREMLSAGVRAVLTCVDPGQLDARFVGRAYDEALLAELPDTVDPCGERGEFHTFCFDGPMFDRGLAVRVGDILERDGFWFADVLPVAIPA